MLSLTISQTAGTGTGITPCWHLIKPVPSYSGDTITSSIFKLSIQTATATISTIESIAPTS